MDQLASAILKNPKQKLLFAKRELAATDSGKNDAK
jgi:hypothetical protein